MSAKRNRLALALCLLAVGGCMRSGGSPMGIPLREVTQFESEWNNYRLLKSRKAIAVAGNLNGVYVSGYAYAYPVQALANAEAIENCEERRLDRRIESECRLYAVEGERIEEAGAE